MDSNIFIIDVLMSLKLKKTCWIFKSLIFDYRIWKIK